MNAKDYTGSPDNWPEDAILIGIVVNGVLHEFPQPVRILPNDYIRWRVGSPPVSCRPTVTP